MNRSSNHPHQHIISTCTFGGHLEAFTETLSLETFPFHCCFRDSAPRDLPYDGNGVQINVTRKFEGVSNKLTLWQLSLKGCRRVKC
eukprot:6114790-Amphidinium_carterae.1